MRNCKASHLNPGNSPTIIFSLSGLSSISILVLWYLKHYSNVLVGVLEKQVTLTEVESINLKLKTNLQDGRIQKPSGSHWSWCTWPLLPSFSQSYPQDLQLHVCPPSSLSKIREARLYTCIRKLVWQKRKHATGIKLFGINMIKKRFRITSDVLLRTLWSKKKHLKRLHVFLT